MSLIYGTEESLKRNFNNFRIEGYVQPLFKVEKLERLRNE
jgi:hypothetical protein